MVLPVATALNINQTPVSSALSRQYPHSTTEASIMRTYNPSYVNYSGDGSGRDLYIILNNGGLTHEAKRNMMWQPRPRQSPRDHSPKPSKPAVAFQYQSDGSGRDSYVI